MLFKCFQFSDKNFLALEGFELEELEDSNSFKFLPIYITALRWPILFIPPCMYKKVKITNGILLTSFFTNTFWTRKFGFRFGFVFQVAFQVVFRCNFNFMCVDSGF